MSAFELNKFVGGFLAAALLACVLAILGEFVYPEPVAPGLPMVASKEPMPTTTGEATATVITNSLAMRLAAADPVNGELQAKKCAVCHTFSLGKNARLGPTLRAVIGREVGTVGGFRYSEAMSKHEGNWTYANLDGFLTSPAKWVPGTKMAFTGLLDESTRADIIVWLRTLSDNPEPLPVDASPSAPETADTLETPETEVQPDDSIEP